MALHGTPGSRRSIVSDERDFPGVRLICVDRPGYELSTFHPGHSLRDSARDLAELCDHLAVGEFYVLGHSGGGPHALACAAVLGERVRAVATLGGLAPLDGPAWGALTKTDQRVMTIARERPLAARVVAEAQMIAFRARPSWALALLARQSPAPDAALLARSDVRAMYLKSAAAASRSTGRALAQDMALLASPWGFDLAEVAAPVDLWHGDLDRSVAPEHSRILKGGLARSTLYALADAGHLFIYDQLGEVIEALVAPRERG